MFSATFWEGAINAILDESREWRKLYADRTRLQQEASWRQR